MALIDLLDLSKVYDHKKILSNVSFHIDEKERVAIVGKNGSGKSTLMQIVANMIDFDEGERIEAQNVEVAMLPQHPTFKESQSVKEAIEEQLVDLKNAKIRHEELSTKISIDFENRELLEEHAKITTFLDHHNAWNLDLKISRIIEELNLVEFENRVANMLSGGEQKRVALAGLLLKKPDILLLDEPTNHLDVYMVEFLEELLIKERFTMLFISHDRYFIDNVATRTIEIEDATLRSFHGGYRDYLRQKEMLLQAKAKEHENLLKTLKQEEEWLRRGVKARLKRNEGRKQRVLAMRENAKKNPGLIRKMSLELDRERKNFNSNESINRQKMLFEIENLSKKLGDRNLMENFSTRILQKDTIAIVGKNGSGKSTFLRILLGDIKQDRGIIKRGDITFGYFDQHREILDEEKNLIETFCPNGGDRVDVRGKNMHVYGYLKNFLFPKEFLDKKIGTLSGGEKNRVALALLFTKNVDCLILDEPTNDLDIPTINILEEYLLSFQGALLFVSHDRYFIDKIAKKLFVFKGDGVVEESYMPYSQYLEVEKEQKEYEELEKEIILTPKEQKPKSTPKKLGYKEQRLLDSLPREIEILESKLEELTCCLSDPKCYEERGIATVAEELEKIKEEYESKGMLFLEIQERAEELNGK